MQSCVVSLDIFRVFSLHQEKLVLQCRVAMSKDAPPPTQPVLLREIEALSYGISLGICSDRDSNRWLHAPRNGSLRPIANRPHPSPNWN